MTQPLVASIENMRALKALPEYQHRQLQAYSDVTGEQYSADPGDYWNANPGWVMTDAEGEPMVLGSMTEIFVEATLPTPDGSPT